MAHSGSTRIALPGLVLAGLLALGVGLGGCSQPDFQSMLAYDQMPPDLAIAFRVHGASQQPSLLLASGAYVLQPDGRLHATRTTAPSDVTFPPLVRHLTRSQMHSIFQVIRDGRLLAEPTSPGSVIPLDRASPTARYEVEITAYGGVHRYQTTPRESPPTVLLLGKLIEAETGTLPSLPALPDPPLSATPPQSEEPSQP